MMFFSFFIYFILTYASMLFLNIFYLFFSLFLIMMFFSFFHPYCLIMLHDLESLKNHFISLTLNEIRQVAETVGFEPMFLLTIELLLDHCSTYSSFLYDQSIREMLNC